MKLKSNEIWEEGEGVSLPIMEKRGEN